MVQVNADTLPQLSILELSREIRDEVLDILENETDFDEIRNRLICMLKTAVKLTDMAQAQKGGAE